MKTNRTFGVEIELAGAIYTKHNEKPDVVCNMPSYRSGQPGYCEVQLQPGWKAVYDGSCGSEFVSPPLVDTEAIRRQIDAIIASKYPISFKDTGLHVHVGAHDLSRYNLLELAKFCRHFERSIYSFVHPSRIKNEFCRPMQLSNEMLGQRFNPNSRLSNSYRYVGCNITSYDKHGTVEYRYSESTMDYDKICALVDLFVKITDYVANNKGSIRKGKTPRKKEEKRRHLLRLVGVNSSTFTKLINTRY